MRASAYRGGRLSRRRSRIVTRGALTAAAVVMCAWYALGIHQFRSEAQVSNVLQRNLLPVAHREALTANRELDSAGS